MLEIKNISFGYKKNIPVLENISLSVASGEILGILGPNGTGKTTFIKCINNILKPDCGGVLFNGKNISNMKQQEIAKIIAYVPQYVSSFFYVNVIDTVMMGRLPYAGRKYSKEDEKIVFEILRKMNLEKFAFRNIKEMSGGERQRVFIARAMAQQPKVIILDEPTSSLDLHNQLFILHTVAELATENNIAIIMTIHDLNLASMFCDKILMLKDKHIFALGTAQEALTEDNVKEIYGVETKITIEDGYKHIRLLK